MTSPNTIIADLQAENELLKQIEANLAELHNVALVENETLRSRLAEIEAQEPVAYVSDCRSRGEGCSITRLSPNNLPVTTFLYAAPVVSPDVSSKYDWLCDKHLTVCTEIQSLKTELAKATTELEAARNDAERYRWLRTAPKADVVVAVAPDEYLSPYGDELDAHIDAAIEQAKGGVK